jgi:hypothetical protein
LFLRKRYRCPAVQLPRYTTRRHRPAHSPADRPPNRQPDTAMPNSRPPESAPDADPPLPTEHAGAAAAGHEFGNRQRHLYNHLVKRGAALVSIPFHDFPTIVGAALPPSAFRDATFWEQAKGAAPSPWAMAWRKAGYEIDTFRLARDGGWVRFKRST